MAPLKESLLKEKAELEALMKNPVNPVEIEIKIDAIAKLKADIQKKCLACCLAVRQLLTEEQKEKFTTCCASAMGMGCHGKCMGKTNSDCCKTKTAQSKGCCTAKKPTKACCKTK
jgi:Spy/CpxP family protein refolding chaperone